MAFNANVVTLMIASPSDVAEERRIVREVLYEWNAVHMKEQGIVALPVGWETHATPELGDRPQAIINKQLLEDCDLLIGIFSTRLGSPTGKAPSGTVEEIEEHVKAGKHAMLYFSEADLPRGKFDVNQYTALEAIKTEYRQRGLVEPSRPSRNFRVSSAVTFPRR